ncbi:type IV secretory system conjugative DNA transfer family protein [Actinomadura syzygii]|uniref:Type IV secretory system conjugative DNA transfer family protein n=1 Tax=Actinomadura syzygii TaxID=1427538 RepID=A0A5D0TS68_9ACTN|nr:type IV secretory system conjugative DNA transfer family protein [Actinomadura syzygii]TYC08543.1 type IV secretory system conjugative DNA transfer family protein [Actinomadura syzygii]
MAWGKRKASRPAASSWDKISAREPGQTLSNRDVHEGQQLDRGQIEAKRSKTPAVVTALVVGVLVMLVVWILSSVIALAALKLGSAVGQFGAGGRPYYAESTRTVDGGGVEKCYQALDSNGQPGGTCYPKADDVPVPKWHKSGKGGADSAKTPGATASLGEQLAAVTAVKLVFSLGAGLLSGVVVGTWMSRRIDAANLMHDTSDINQYDNDQHIALPEEIQRTYDWFPDAGAHSSVEVSSMISHMMLQNTGLKKIEVSRRAEADIVDEDGAPLYYKGEILDDEEGGPLTDTLPLVDEKFGDELFEASGLPDDKALRKKYSTAVIPYNGEGKDRGKLGRFTTVKDLLNHDWELPAYEVQRPAGAYIVDTAPVNTMVLAITRAGKGQTYIEPMLDMWSREKKPSNMVINDPKGELLVKNYIPMVTRGFEPVQFNLINAMKTDIYNPLGMAADAAREGNSTKCALYVENIADVFFPLDGGEDPVWPNAANNAFKRAAYGLIDFYLEEERELREHAATTGMEPETLENKLDDMWGKVTLYNCYQLFVQLTSKKVKNPEAELDRRVKAGEFEGDEDRLAEEAQEATSQAFLWEGKAEQDMLTLYFNATEALPTNTMRTLIGNANNALRAMAGAEKMLASVYGIAITAMSFFTDPTISTLTSGKPSQNTDLAGLSFPRRLGVRFSQNYLKRDNLIGQQAVWSAYADPMFTQDLGEDFGHAEIVGREGWARYNFKGIFPTDQAWLKLELVNPQSKMLVRTFYFHFRKNYQLSLNGRHFVVEPVTGKKIVKKGVIRELRPVREDGARDGRITAFKPADTLYPQARLNLSTTGAPPERAMGQTRAITQTMVHYCESPKAVFLVTPPHLMKYAKLILILVKQLVDISFDQSYMTKNNQKPLYRTRFMLDELGNLQSEGNGISGLETMLSIGLGQEQQFTLILQTLQQLRDVYGESVDKIVQSNVSNIVFLKSTDDSMIETLEKMSGTTHKSYIDSKQISRDLDKVIGGRTEGRVTYTMNTREEPLIKYNDMYYIGERNSIVFRAGDAPVWNRNETILPMSWRLLKNTIVHPGHDYSLQTIPTLSSAMDFDVRMNQPDFRKMLDKRMRQAFKAAGAKQQYQNTYGYADIDIERLDPDVYSDEVMEIVQMMVNLEAGRDPRTTVEADADDLEAAMIFDEDQVVDNIEVAAEVAAREAVAAKRAEKIYAEGTISKDMLLTPDGTAKLKSLDRQIAEAYKSCLSDIAADRQHFSVGGDDQVRSADGSRAYITPQHSQAYRDAAAKLNGSIGDEGSRVWAEEDLTADDLTSLETVTVHADFYQYLASLPSWEHLAAGAFDRAMAVEMNNG